MARTKQAKKDDYRQGKKAMVGGKELRKRLKSHFF